MTRYKVLGLHGFAQTGLAFSKKAGALRKTLARIGVEIIFPTAPHRIQATDASGPGEREKLLEAERSNEDWQYWGWAFADDEKKEMRDLDKSVEFISKIMEEQGPFVGILGFSQGAAVAAVITSILETSRSQTLFPSINHPPLNFFVSFSGFRMKFEQYNQFYPISTPNLHVIGTLDTVVVESRMIALVESCLNPRVLKHIGGHFIPNASSIRNDIVQFIEDNLGEQRETNGELN